MTAFARRKRFIIGAVVIALAAATAGGVAALSSIGSTPRAGHSAAAPASQTPVAPASSIPPTPRKKARHRPRPHHRTSRPAATPSNGSSQAPAGGALLGAYVRPVRYTAADEILAVQSFQRQVGHRLDLVHVYHPWTNSFPSPADTYFADSGQALLLTWGGEPSTTAILAGQYDAMIRARAAALKALHRPVMLEWRHEMDRPDLQAAMHSAADYVAAWKHIRAIFSAAGATNVSWVWCPTAWGFTTGRAAAYYPGDQEVDWICADAYSPTPTVPLSKVLGPFLGWAAAHPKPIVIGEFGVSGNGAGWAAWLRQVGDFVHQHPQIKALAYFDSTPDGGQTLAGNSSATAAFGQLFDQPYFTSATTARPRS
jgi:hypothetical protein